MNKTRTIAFFAGFLLLLVGIELSAQTCCTMAPGSCEGSVLVPNCGPLAPTAVKASGFTPSCTPSSNFLARATNITLTADKTNYDNLICGLNTDTTWARADAVYVFGAPDVTTAKLNLVSSSFGIVSHGTNVDTTQFTASAGWTGNGTDVYLDTQFNPNTAGGNYTAATAGVVVYNLLNRTSGGNQYMFGVQITNQLLLLMYQFGAAGTQAINLGSGSFSQTFAGTNGFTALRQGSGNSQLYNWSTVLGNSGSLGTTGNTPALPNGNIFYLALNSSGATLFDTSQFMFGAIGGFTDTDIHNLATRMNTFAAAYSHSQYSCPC